MGRRVSDEVKKANKAARDKRYRVNQKKRAAVKAAAAATPAVVEGGADALDAREPVETAGDDPEGEGGEGGNERGVPPVPVYAQEEPEPPRA